MPLLSTLPSLLGHNLFTWASYGNDTTNFSILGKVASGGILSILVPTVQLLLTLPVRKNIFIPTLSTIRQSKRNFRYCFCLIRAVAP